MAVFHAFSRALLFASVLMGTTVQAQTSPIFFDDFSQKNRLSDAWQIASWVNGHPFGCSFSPLDVSQHKGLLKLSFSGNSGKCAEVRTRQFWQFGRFIVDMKPANIAGSVSSFFLYDGVANTATHNEIDIEFVGGKPFLHTNFWTQGKPSPLDIDLRTYGIDPFAQSRQYSFVWEPDSISWHVTSDAGQWVEVRKVAVRMSAPLQLMMNAWYGDNLDTALSFPGYYDGTPGVAEYRSVWIGR